MKAPHRVLRLVETFGCNVSAYKSGKYNETQVRREFIDPLFEELGWDVANKKGYAEAYKDVIHEDAIKIGGFTKAPDYCFRIGGTRKFFLEAKKPAVNIKEDFHPAFQLRRYGWSAKLPLSILTDFEEFAVYDCRVRPTKTDKVSHGRILYLTFSDYLTRWEELAAVFSREAVLKGSFDKYVESNKTKKGTTEVDDEFLREIERWRELLARNVSLRNPSLTQRELNIGVQRTIDRIVFLRICEDRGIEEYGRLLSLGNGVQCYERLLHLFRQADDKYNSGLFHFRAEKHRPDHDNFTPHLKIDDKVIKDVVKNLYYPDSPYEFSVLPADILGQVYERFLGKVIRLTATHQAKIEEKPEVRKAGGVYYTPGYIVDYIVDNTVGRLVRGKKPALYQGMGGHWRLTTQERKRILLNNIFGVDRDYQAVEVTKLSLLLKVLEGEDEQTIGTQLRLFQQRVLPDLSGNIKCGNSLISNDFYDHQRSFFADEEVLHRLNVFDWEAEFSSIMEEGGFDVVIGNPPYVRQEGLKEAKHYFKTHYASYHGMADLYVYFVEKGISLLKEGGLFSYIVANKWLRANYGTALRRWLKTHCIEQIIDFGDLPVFSQATTYPCILVVGKRPPRPTFAAARLMRLPVQNLADHINNHRYDVRQGSLSDAGWALVSRDKQDLLDKLYEVGIPLSEYVGGKIYYGIKTGLNEAFVISEQMRDHLITQDPASAQIIKPFLAGRDIKRYQALSTVKYLILFPRGFTTVRCPHERQWQWLKEQYPAIADHLAQFEEKATLRYDKGDYWWELRACDYYREFEKPKILYPDISERGSFSLDREGGKYFANTAYMIPNSEFYLLGVLNSSLIHSYYKNVLSVYRGGYLRFFDQYVKLTPIKALSLKSSFGSIQHNDIEENVEHMLDLQQRFAVVKTRHDKAVLSRAIGAADSRIDRLVYELYGLTEKEIHIVEEAGS
jgi:hypothetical protein